MLNAAGLFNKEQGDFAEGRRLLEESCVLWAELGTTSCGRGPRATSPACSRSRAKWTCHSRGHDESLALFRQLGDRAGVGWSLRHQGDIARERHDQALAESLYLQSLEAFRALGGPWSAGSLLTDSSGNLALSIGETAKGVEHLRRAVETFQQFGGHKRGLARGADGLALGGVARRQRAPRDTAGRGGCSPSRRHRHGVDTGRAAADGFRAGLQRWRSARRSDPRRGRRVDDEVEEAIAYGMDAEA